MSSRLSVHLASGVRMLSSHVVLAASAVPSAGTVVALLLHNTVLAALAVVAGVGVTAAVVVTNLRIRWQRHRSWMDNERIRTQALGRVAQDYPDRVVALPQPSGGSFAPAVPAEGPAPPEAQAVGGPREPHPA